MKVVTSGLWDSSCKVTVLQVDTVENIIEEFIVRLFGWSCAGWKLLDVQICDVCLSVTDFYHFILSPSLHFCLKALWLFSLTLYAFYWISFCTYTYRRVEIMWFKLKSKSVTALCLLCGVAHLPPVPPLTVFCRRLRVNRLFCLCLSARDERRNCLCQLLRDRFSHFHPDRPHISLCVVV